MPWFPPHVPVGARRARVARVSDELRRNGVDVQPVHIEGRTIARSFWGRRWCHHLESCSDFENRLPRGRVYVRNGCVCHLDVHAGGVDAMVVGSDLYHVVVRIRKLGQVAWKTIRAECAGRVGSVLELLQGRLSDHVLRVVTDPDRGLFPKPGEITLTCDCPDWAVMCKHAAAVLRHRSRPGGQRRGGRSAADHRTPPAPPREAASDRRPAGRVPAYGPPRGRATPPGRILGPRVRRPALRIRVDGVPLGSGPRAARPPSRSGGRIAGAVPGNRETPDLSDPARSWPEHRGRRTVRPQPVREAWSTGAEVAEAPGWQARRRPSEGRRHGSAFAVS